MSLPLPLLSLRSTWHGETRAGRGNASPSSTVGGGEFAPARAGGGDAVPLHGAEPLRVVRRDLRVRGQLNFRVSSHAGDGHKTVTPHISIFIRRERADPCLWSRLGCHELLRDDSEAQNLKELIIRRGESGSLAGCKFQVLSSISRSM